jgi:hypothetical protein
VYRAFQDGQALVEKLDLRVLSLVFQVQVELLVKPVGAVLLGYRDLPDGQEEPDTQVQAVSPVSLVHMVSPVFQVCLDGRDSVVFQE